MRMSIHLTLASAAFAFSCAFYWYKTLAARQSPRVVRVATQRNYTPPKVAQVLKETFVQNGTASVRAAIEAAPAGPGGEKLVAAEELFASLPALKAAFVDAAAANKRLTLTPFVTEAGLAPDEASELLQIVSARERAWSDICAAARLQGLRLDDPLIKEMDRESASAAEGEIKALLGEERYRQYQEFRSASDARSGVLSLNNIVLASLQAGQALSRESVSELAKICNQEKLFEINGAIVAGYTPDFAKIADFGDAHLSGEAATAFYYLLEARMVAYDRGKQLYEKRR